MDRTDHSTTEPAGRSVIRKDAHEKVTGAAIFTVDVGLRDSLHGVAVRAERAHATIRGVDKDAALAAPGVVAVVTSDDLGDLFPRFGHVIADHPILAIDKVRYWGEPVALVVATTRDLAHDGARLVRVEYDDLPAPMTVDEALAADAAVLHDGAYDAGDGSFASLSGGVVGASEEERHPNIVHEVALGWGDVDAALADAHLVVEGETRYPMLYAYAMEPYNAVASFNGAGLHVVSSAQHPYQVREDLARIFSLPYGQVRVESPYLGGGYGSKSYTKVEPLAAVGSYITGRPVKVVLTIEESIYTTRADSAVTRVRTGFAEDGTILARDFDLVLDSGAYADNSPLVLGKAASRCSGPYRIPNLRVRARSVYTCTAPASSYRGFGAPQGNLAGETNLDQAADRLGLDPLELRKRNLVERGEELIPGKRPLDAKIAEDLDMVVERLAAAEPPRDGWLRGQGFGCSASDAGAFPISTATVRALCDGSVHVLTGSTEMGQGSRTALAQIAAQELGVAVDAVTVLQSDTSLTPYERTTGASRTTTLTGLAVQRACAEVRAKARDMAADTFDTDTDSMADVAGGVRLADGREFDFEAVLTRWFGSRAGEITGVGLVRKGGDTDTMPPFWEVGAVGVTLDIDPDTGFVSVAQLVTVGDVGFAINPAAVEAQDLGAATQGLGAALFEELIYDGPHPINPNVVDYRVPRMGDVAERIDTMLAQRGDGVGPYGAKGAGEGALNPVGGAVASAVARALGVWPSQLPLTPERVWGLLQSDKPG